MNRELLIFSSYFSSQLFIIDYNNNMYLHYIVDNTCLFIMRRSLIGYKLNIQVQL